MEAQSPAAFSILPSRPVSISYNSASYLYTSLLTTRRWWIAGLILHRNDYGWVVPFLVWLGITVRLLTFYVPITVVTKPMHFVWNNSAVRFSHMIPEKMRVPLGALLTIAVILFVSVARHESQDNTRPNRAISLLGVIILIGAMYATSRNRRKIKWHTVIVGMLVQFIIALFVLRSQAGFDIFNFISGLALDLLGFAGKGTSFLTDPSVLDTHWFLVGVIPAIIFFVSFVQLLYYWGLLQWVSWIFRSCRCF